MKNQDPTYKTTKLWMWVVITPFTLILLFLVTIGLLSHYEITPATHVKSKSEITSKDRNALIGMQLIDNDTVVEGFYSYGLFSLREGGVVMTDEELIIYMEDESVILYDSMHFDKMQWVKQLKQGSDLEYSLFQVSGKEQYTGFQFDLSTENNGDTVFYQKLELKMNPPPPAKPMPMPQL